MITAIWGCGGTGESAIACGLGNLYAAKGTAAVIDTNLCQPTLPLRLPGVRLEAERSLGRYLNRLGDSEVRRYYHQHPDNKGLFFAGLTDRDAYTDFEIGLEAADRARVPCAQRRDVRPCIAGLFRAAQRPVPAGHAAPCRADRAAHRAGYRRGTLV